MSTGISKCCNICHIVHLRLLLRSWRNKAVRSLSATSCIPVDVPAGHIAVVVGARKRRFVVPTWYLNHPVFTNLLRVAEEEYGFSSAGLLAFPCDESVFEDVLQFMSQTESKICSIQFEDFQRGCNWELGNTSLRTVAGLR